MKKKKFCILHGALRCSKATAYVLSMKKKMCTLTSHCLGAQKPLLLKSHCLGSGDETAREIAFKNKMRCDFWGTSRSKNTKRTLGSGEKVEDNKKMGD